MNSIRLWIARKLAPEVFKDAERFNYVRMRLDDLSTWCGSEFPIVHKAADWVRRSTRIHFMSLAEYHGLVTSSKCNEIAVGGIDAFRERLRQERDVLASTKGEDRG